MLGVIILTTLVMTSILGGVADGSQSSCKNGQYLSDGKCIDCGCDLDGVADVNDLCDSETGLCKCKPYTYGSTCALCTYTHYKDSKNNNTCTDCGCSRHVGYHQNKCGVYRICDENDGHCYCHQAYGGSAKCDQCGDDYENIGNGYLYCIHKECNKCNNYGTSNCGDATNNKCKCSTGFTGPRCFQCSDPGKVIQDGLCVCADGTYRNQTGACVPCVCDRKGTNYCSNSQCVCFMGYKGAKCDECKGGRVKKNDYCSCPKDTYPNPYQSFNCTAKWWK